MKFNKSHDSSWNALVVYVNSQCILAGSKPQKKNFLILSYFIETLFINAKIIYFLFIILINSVQKKLCDYDILL